jgi:hypothetical protein
MEKLNRIITARLPKKTSRTPDGMLLLQRLGFEKRTKFGRKRIITNPEDPKYLKRVKEIFPIAFVEEDLRLAIDMVSPQLVAAFDTQTTDQSRRELIQFAVQITPAVETLYPEAILFESQAIANRIAHTITEVQKAIRIVNNEPLLTRSQRDLMHRDFSKALVRTSPTIQPVTIFCS